MQYSLSSKLLGYFTRYVFACTSFIVTPLRSLAGRSQREVLAMTLCQRPKECEPSRYRHGSDPPRQVETAFPTHSRRAPSPSSTPSSFDPFTYIQSNVTELQAGTMPGHHEGGLFHVTVYDHCRRSLCRERSCISFACRQRSDSGVPSQSREASRGAC